MAHVAELFKSPIMLVQAGYQHGMAAARQAQHALQGSPQLAAGPSEGGVQ